MIKTTLVEALDTSEKSLIIEMLDFIIALYNDCSVNEFDSISIGEEKVTYTAKDLDFFKSFIFDLSTGGNKIEFNKRNKENL